MKILNSLQTNKMKIEKYTNKIKINKYKLRYKGESMSSLDEILNKINEAKNIIILTHENPDGDAIGTSLALYMALKNINKDVELIIPKYSRVFNCMPGIENLQEEGKKRRIRTSDISRLCSN